MACHYIYQEQTAFSAYTWFAQKWTYYKYFYTQVADSWPTKGNITLLNVSLRYRRELPNVLNGISINIAPAQKIGNVIVIHFLVRSMRINAY